MRMPLGNGILTVENDAQAWARASVADMNKGGGAVEAALAVLRIKRTLAGADHGKTAPNASRCTARRRAGALPDGCRRHAASSRPWPSSRRIWIGREVEGIKFQPSDMAFFRDSSAAWSRTSAPIDLKIDAALAAGWPLTRIEAVLRAILRAGGYELMFRKDVPARVVISEYVDVAHGFLRQDEPGSGQRRARHAGARRPRPANSTRKRPDRRKR